MSGPNSLNLASMQDNNRVGVCSYTRTVGNPMRNFGHWTLSVDAPDGAQIDVHPTDPSLFTKTVDQATAGAGDVLGCESRIPTASSRRCGPT